MDIHIPQNVVDFLASKITSNVRELEGALNKVIAHSTLVGREVTLESTQEILRDLLRSNEKIITIEDRELKYLRILVCVQLLGQGKLQCIYRNILRRKVYKIRLAIW